MDTASTEWKDALAKEWGVLETTTGQHDVNIEVTLYDPVVAIELARRVLSAALSYYEGIAEGEEPVSKLTRAMEAADEAHWYLIDDDYEG